MNEKYLAELSHHDGENIITLNIVELKKGEVVVAITNQGRISVVSFDLMESNGRLYFEYGIMLEEIYIEDFTLKGELK